MTFPRDPNASQGRSEAVRQSIADKNAQAAKERQTTIAVAFLKYLNNNPKEK